MLSRFVSLLRARGKLVAIGTASCGILALALSWLAKPVYEGRVSVLVTDSTDRTSWRAQASVTSVRAILENLSLATQVIKEFGLDRPPHELTAWTFLKGSLIVQEVKGTDVIRLTVRLSQPQLAAQVANRIAELAVELNRRVNRAQVEFVKGFINDEIDKAQAHMKDVEARLLAFKEGAQIEVARKDMESKLGQRGQLLGLQVDIEAEAARLAKAEEELANQERIFTIKRSLDGDRVLTEAARTASNPGTSLVGLELREELVNQVYETLAQQVAASRTKLSALRRQRAELTGPLKVGAPEVPGLSQLYKKESDLAKLELEYDLARKVYSDLVVRLEAANQGSRSTELHVVDAALAPARPISPRPLLNLALGILGGLVVSTSVAFLLESVGAPAKGRDAAT